MPDKRQVQTHVDGRCIEGASPEGLPLRRGFSLLLDFPENQTSVARKAQAGAPCFVEAQPLHGGVVRSPVWSQELRRLRWPLSERRSVEEERGL